MFLVKNFEKDKYTDDTFFLDDKMIQEGIELTRAT